MHTQKKYMEKMLNKFTQAMVVAGKLLPSEIAVSTATEKRLLLYPRTGVERMAPLLADLVARAGVVLAGHDPARMIAALTRATVLDTARSALTELLARIDDTAQRERSAAWQTFIAYYRTLSAVAATDANVARDLEPIAEMFAQTKRKPAENVEDVEPAPLPIEPVKVVNG